MPFLEVDEGRDGLFHFVHVASRIEVFAIRKEKPMFGSKWVYRAISGGREIWRLNVKAHMFNADEYILTINGPRHLVSPVVHK